VERGGSGRGERLALAAVGVALHTHVDESERELRRVGDLTCGEDQPCAGPEDGLAAGVELLQRRHEAPGVHQLEQRGALAARDDETVDSLELLGLADLHRLHGLARERLRVTGEVALQSEDADLHSSGSDHQPRVCIRSFSASFPISSPTMASPRSSLTFTSTSGSLKCVVACTMALARLAGSADLKMPEPTKTASAPSCIMSAASAGVAMPPA